MKFTDRLLLRDARLLGEVLPAIDPCVDVIITSPPYWNLKDYGVPGQIGYGQTKEEYLADMEKVLKDCLLVTKPTGSLWLIVDTYRDNGELQLLPFELAEHARQAGWRLREVIVWDKQHSVPWHREGQLRHVSEFILFMTKSDEYKYHLDRIKNLDEISKWWVDFPERFSPKGKTPTNIWNIPMRPRGAWRKPSENNHYCSFPTALVARIIELTTDPGDLVMDPFAGSGVVLAQATAMGRHYVGFEISKKYARMFETTVKNEVATEWEEMKAWRQSQTNSQADFEQTIMKLRALKYARQVTRPFVEALGARQRTQVQAILCMASVPNKYERKHPFDVKILMVVNQHLPKFEAALQAARARATQPPLSQYEIHSDIQVVTYQDLKKQPKLLRQRFYFYPKHKPRSYSASGSLLHWFENGNLEALAEQPKIPMLANIAVDVAWALENY